MLKIGIFKPSGWARIVGACALVGALSACGGGGGDDAVVGAATPTTPVTPAPAPTTPATAAAPATAPSTGIENTGNLNYLVVEENGSSSTLPATVSFTAPNGTLTLLPGPDELVITTADSWANVTWPADFSGALRANGNMTLVCSVEPGQGHFVLVSHNMTAVPSNEAVAAVSGKTFRSVGCENGTVETETFAFNADGSVTDGADSVSAADIALAFSAAGLDVGDGANIKLALYAYTVGGVTRYHIVEVAKDFVGNVLTPRLSLASERSLD